MNKSGGVECLAWTWGIATLVGIFAAAMLWSLGGWTFMQGAFMGVICLLVLGAILTIMMCRGSGAPAQGSAGKGTGASAYVASGVVSPAPAPAAPAPAASAASSGADQAAAAAAKAEADKVAAKAEADRAAAAAKADADRAAADAAAKAEADRAAAAASTAAATAAPAAAADPAAAGPGTRPDALDGPRGGTADDLKRIKGVGPKMETMCNDLGFYHFDQIAAWTADEVAWVDQNLKGFKGRVSRDSWVDQARLLAAGGETEFSKKVDGGDVY
jgi:predicted flap endonuclease-1-like 5' DNA nuclease